MPFLPSPAGRATFHILLQTCIKREGGFVEIDLIKRENNDHRVEFSPVTKHNRDTRKTTLSFTRPATINLSTKLITNSRSYPANVTFESQIINKIIELIPAVCPLNYIQFALVIWPSRLQHFKVRKVIGVVGYKTLRDDKCWPDEM